MDRDVQNRLAQSLTAESTELIPYLPYLLQDFWSLAGDPDEMIRLLQAHTAFGPDGRLLDLACGKGIAAIQLCKAFGCTAKGIDLIPAFIEVAEEKAREHGVAGRCTFAAQDIHDAVLFERDYDVLVYSGAGDLLGGFPETMAGIVRTIRPGGYILMDEGYLPETAKQELRFHHDYLTRAQWDRVFQDNNLTVVACSEAEPEADPSAYAQDLANIRKRAQELALRHPDKRTLFEGYVRSQQAEYEDLQDRCLAALWLLQKGEA